MTKSINRLFVLLCSYSLVYFIEWLDRPFNEYYFSLLFSGLIVTYLCVRVSDWLLIGYAVLQVLLMVAYFYMLTPYYPIADWIIYFAPLNLSLIVLSYEIFMFIIGGANVACWLYSRSYSDSYHMSSRKKVNQL